MLPHERLDVYQCALKLLALCNELCQPLLKTHPAIADQLQRAALSIPLNIAEGVGKTGPRGSAMECAAIVDVVGVLQAASVELLNKTKELTIRIVAMLTRMCR
jgi:four helix bundle protein